MQEKNRKKSNFFERISQIIDYYEIKSVKSFACDWLGYDSSQKINRLKEENTSPSYEILNDISNKFEKINTEWLLTGQGKMLKSDNLESNKTHKHLGVPLLPVEVIAGFGGNDIPGIRYEDCEQYAVPEFERSGVEFVIRVSGSSMYPKYSNGDILACRKINDILFFQWGKIYVIDSSQGILVKRIFEHENSESILLVSENKEKYKPFPIPKSDIRSLSIVLGVIRME